MHKSFSSEEEFNNQINLIKSNVAKAIAHSPWPETPEEKELGRARRNAELEKALAPAISWLADQLINIPNKKGEPRGFALRDFHHPARALQITASMLKDIKVAHRYNAKFKLELISFYDLWLNSDSKRTVDRLVMRRGNTLGPELFPEPRTINAWCGWHGGSGDENENLASVTQSITEGRDAAVKWLAWAVQNPTTRSAVPLILEESEPGDADKIVQNLRKVFGRSYANCRDVSSVPLERCQWQFAECALLHIPWVGKTTPRRANLVRRALTAEMLKTRITLRETIDCENATKAIIVVQRGEGRGLLTAFGGQTILAHVADAAGSAPQVAPRTGGWLVDLLTMEIGGWSPVDELGAA